MPLPPPPPLLLAVAAAAVPPFRSVSFLQIHLRSAHRCGSRCHGGHHSYLADDQRAEGRGGRGGFTGSGTYSAAALAAAATPTDSSRGGTAGDAEKKGFQESVAGIFSPGRGRRGGGGGFGRDDGGFVRGDHYCRVRVGRKGGSSELVEVRAF